VYLIIHGKSIKEICKKCMKYLTKKKNMKCIEVVSNGFSNKQYYTSCFMIHAIYIFVDV
jgi:hypothetical protein